MKATLVRQIFLDFFRSRSHVIVPSAPMVIKNDPTLMFTNAGMNQFKQIFLDTAPTVNSRVADTQKCLRVSGKHNDLEEVGHDGYHHTMFEMLGNWSFGDYFKEEAIAWAWQFLTEIVKIDKSRLYVTVFEGDATEHLERDTESFDQWTKWIDPGRILLGSKKDNFWEMGDSGPCGPCSEIHVDMRSGPERGQTDGSLLVNQGHPQVIEIWNLVFIQYNRRTTGELELLPKKHVDTGMGFERLCRVLQHKSSNYDTDIFLPIIEQISSICERKYGENEQADIAMRVISDHIRAIAFAIADGQLPSNAKAGYVIRRILRRAVRYYYTSLGQKSPMIFRLVPALISTLGDAFPELRSQQSLIEKVIREEEQSFLRTLESGIKRLEQMEAEAKKSGKLTITGKQAFELYDTYGFPLDLTELMLKGHRLIVDRNEFEEEMDLQRKRSKSAAAVDTDDWVIVNADASGEAFIGYDQMTAGVKITRYRKVKSKEGEVYHLVFDHSPFYAESGGQTGDTGIIDDGIARIPVINTFKEHNLHIHLTQKLPTDVTALLKATVDRTLRMDIEKNHSATHLLHFALREILGKHVEQKGSLVHPDYLRFDFSHFQKVSEEELKAIENLVNQMIRESQPAHIREESYESAQKAGAMALFGEKYGDQVRVVQFGNSVELCGGTHVGNTSLIGSFKIVSESSVAAGIRRIEAITGRQYERYVSEQESLLSNISDILGNPGDLVKSVTSLVEENAAFRKKLEQISQEQINRTKRELISQVRKTGEINLVSGEISGFDNADAIRDLAYQIRNQMENVFIVLGSVINGKPILTVMLSDKLVAENKLNAGEIIRAAAPEIKGGGGGQPFFATAGGKNPEGLSKAIEKAISFIPGN
jgi:alanyl-tRNA synthetase